MAITTTADLNGLFNTIYERALLIIREMNLMSALVTNYSANNFYTRQFSSRPELTVSDATEGIDFAYAQAYGKTAGGTLVPGEKMVQTIITDIAMMNDPDPLMQDASQEMGFAIAEKIDTDLVSVFSSFTKQVGTAGSALTFGNVAAGISVLRTRHAPGQINIVLHPYQWHDIFVQLGSPTTNQAFLGDLANEALRQYFVGNWLAARWFVSSNIRIDASDDATGGIFTQQAIAFDSRIAPSLRPQRDESLRAWELNMVAGWAFGLGPRPTYGIKVVSDVTEPTA